MKILTSQKKLKRWSNSDSAKLLSLIFLVKDRYMYVYTLYKTELKL